MSNEDNAKSAILQQETHSLPKFSNDGIDHVDDENEEKRLVRKVDRRLLPILGALYSIAFIDRANVSVLHIWGLKEHTN